ncbi:beta-1,3-glucan-binding protein-like [Pogonomyrmex barbatus]|uniref:Beta-1,3-glucan-binding protein-like n=1 Tax=Pogonomyrmex barbatus TaxID=144034 RepID=A0A6I9WJS8_9HYME|nr:beta-1,3-glucan-binding protein-like [Pogonomyrmex barbatus]XP_011643361.1 beta-1,3-glucan-binding protein-like [Pogonomyrmex barbatus]
MRKYLISARLILSIIFLAIICENYAYRPPEATVQPLHPMGLRVSIPDEHGITLVAFHIKFNEDFDGLEAGHIAKDIIKIRNGRWTYEDRRTQLKRDDIIYYWVHVVYEGLGYNLIDQSYRVTDFYNYDGSLHVADTASNTQSCTTTSVTWIFKNGGRRQACPRQLIFEDNFDNLNSTKWNLLKQFAGMPDYEFVVYMTDNVTDISDGRLRIKPVLLESKYSREFVLREKLTLDDCTGNIGSHDCLRQGFGASILPPVISGRINTKEKFEFLFGRIEVRAKLPHGDWVYPVITLESREKTWDRGLHNEIRIASSVGNEELRTPDGEVVSGRVLIAGGLVVTVNGSDIYNNNRETLPKRNSGKPWSDDFHIFEIEWKSSRIVTKVDGVQYGEQTIDVSFAKPSYLTLGVAVGGIHEFQDHVTSSGYVKPWRNVQAKAMYNFYQAKDQWYPTWDTKTALQVDYVKVWAL